MLPRFLVKGIVASCAAVAGVLAVASPTSPLYSKAVMPLMRQVDAETAHVLAVKLASMGLVPRDSREDPSVLNTRVWGIEFRNPVGLAAGFDKHAEAIDGMLGIGFGFVEIGSVTPQPQPGNDKPRVFRLLDDQAVINRYGFNSKGLDYAAERLQVRAEHPETKSKGILGINLGKNKSTVDAADDYVKGIEALSKFADYIVINISSPNTPGLRALQGKEELSTLIDRVLAARNKQGIPSATGDAQQRGRLPPLLVKIAPDLTAQDKQDIAAVALAKKVDGLIVSNTTVSRPSTLRSPPELASQTGGLSGKPLFDLSTQALSDMYKLTEGKLPIVGAGGVSTGDDAFEKITSGASLVQLYSALSLEGPGVVRSVKDRLAHLLAANGFSSVAEAVGAKHRGFQRKV